MNAHGQLAVPHFVLSIVVVLHVLKELIGRGKAHFDGTILCHQCKREASENDR